jgi:hypothetical protein
MLLQVGYVYSTPSEFVDECVLWTTFSEDICILNLRAQERWKHSDQNIELEALRESNRLPRVFVGCSKYICADFFQ